MTRRAMDPEGNQTPTKRCRKRPIFSVVFVGGTLLFLCCLHWSPQRRPHAPTNAPDAPAEQTGVNLSASCSSGGADAEDAGVARRQKVRLLYNRVPKCGSTTLLTLLRRLSTSNGFQHLHCRIYDKRLLTHDQQAQFVEEVTSAKAPCSYDRHVYFLDFEKFGQANPAYVNIIRDPVDRIASSFYYSRAIAARRSDPTRRKARWLREKFEDCVERGADGCSFQEGKSHRSLMVPYFCGHDPRCLLVQNSWALDRARQNIERHFSVVGVLEDLNLTLALLEWHIPRFFRGATELYRKSGLHKNRNRSGPSRVAQWVRDLLHRNLSLEFELYDIVRQRLHAQRSLLGHEGQLVGPGG
ncbi:heparan sulfate 2-O-sulfotransferase pipe [Amblyomma americanum]